MASSTHIQGRFRQAPEVAPAAGNRVAGGPGPGLQGASPIDALTRLWASPRARLYPMLGVLLSPAMPLGLLALHAFQTHTRPTLAWARNDVAVWLSTYLYIAVASVLVAAALGHVLGRWFDRAQLLSFTDALTGAFNRRYFGERLSAEMSRARRSGHPTSVLCLDVDHLKAINDRDGHRAGDEALVSVVKVITKTLRPSDVAARLGGDEFAVLLPETTAAQATALAERIVVAVSKVRTGSARRLDVSIGISELSLTAGTADLLSAADAALYRAKAAGGGQTAQAEPVVGLRTVTGCA